MTCPCMYEIFMLIQALGISTGSSVLRDLITNGKHRYSIELRLNPDVLAARAGSCL
jgi:hypothetical protein